MVGDAKGKELAKKLAAAKKEKVFLKKDVYEKVILLYYRVIWSFNNSCFTVEIRYYYILQQ